MTMDRESEPLTPQRINELRQQNRLAVAITCYLDLPDDEAEAFMEDPARPDVVVFDRDMSWSVLEIMKYKGHPIDDEATRALYLFIALGPDRQAVLAPVIEAALNSKPAPGLPDLFAGENVDATWRANIREKGFDEAERIRHEAEAVTGPVEAPGTALDANDVVEAASNIIRFPRAD